MVPTDSVSVASVDVLSSAVKGVVSTWMR